MNKKRPVNLDLTTISMPSMAIASILHRISGLVLFLLLPLLVYCMYLSLVSQESFNQLISLLQHPISKLILWAFLTALVYHLLAGIRHLLMDVGIGEHLNQGRFSAQLVIGLSAVLTILLGIWIW